MKQALLALGLLGFAQSAVCAPIFCGGGTSGYTLLVAGNTATLKQFHHALQFGNLTCSLPKSALANGPFKVCSSKGIRDDGYVAVLSTDAATAQTSVSLGKLWKGGTRHLANIPCAVALNH